MDANNFNCMLEPDQEPQALRDHINCLISTNASFKDQIVKLELELKDARLLHLEQLRAIVQMLEPLATHEDKGSLYLSHFGKAAMVYMIQQVIYANIRRLDPRRSMEEDGF